MFDFRKRRSILVIEDDKVLANLIEHRLTRHEKMRVISAPCGVSGLEAAARERPDLILLDINLPGMSGYQVLEKLSLLDETRDTPVIAITANAMNEDITNGNESGFKDYLTKPLDVEKFLDVSDQWLR